MPARQHRVGAQALGGDQVARHALGLSRLLLGGRVEEQLRPVPGDDDPVAEALARLVVEVERAQPLAELQAMLLVVEVNLDSPLVGHGRKSLMAARGRALQPWGRAACPLASLRWRCRRPGS